MRTLRGKVAVVAGASRGAGRGIARALGEAGATVYVTGRSVRGKPSTDAVAPRRLAGIPALGAGLSASRRVFLPGGMPNETPT